MSRTYKDNNKARGHGKRDRRISIRAVRREPLDVRKLGKALVRIAMEEAAAEVDAQAQATDEEKQPPRKKQQESADE